MNNYFATKTMKSTLYKLCAIALAFSLSTIASPLFAGSTGEKFDRGTITRIFRAKKQIFIDKVPHAYTKETSFYYHGSKNKTKLSIDDLDRDMTIKYQVVEDKNGVVLVNVGVVTG